MVIIALLLVVGVIFGAMYYVKSTLAKRVPQSGFDNPAYQSAAGAVTIDVNPAGAGDKSGYMDIPYSFQNEKAAKVPPASAQATGYMDVAPGGFQDDDEEEDV